MTPSPSPFPANAEKGDIKQQYFILNVSSLRESAGRAAKARGVKMDCF